MPSNAGRGTTQDSQRRGSTKTNAGRSQGKNQSTTSARNAGGRSGTASSPASQRETTTGQRGTSATSQSTQRGTSAASQSNQRGTPPARQSNQIEDRSSQIKQTEIAQTQAASTTAEQTTISPGDREMPMQSSRETGERETTQRGTGESIGRRAGGQTSQIQSGYGGGYGTIGNPFMAVRRIMEDMDRLASNFGFGGGLFTPSLFGQDPYASVRGSVGGSSGQGLPMLLSPQVDVFQRGDQIIVRADLPGLKKENVTVEIDQSVLTIRGERTQELEDDNEGVYRSERSYGTFQRSIALPDGVTAEDAQASFNDGVLEISIPKPKSQARSRKVQIR